MDPLAFSLEDHRNRSMTPERRTTHRVGAPHSASCHGIGGVMRDARV
jgi:hypothetical protein